MTAYKDEKTGKWMSRYTYKTWDGKVVRSKKRGFETKREALQWERELLQKKSGSNDMTFRQFVECYKEDLRPRLKISTFETKESIIDKRILPYFTEKALNEINATDVMQWQNTMMKRVNPKTGNPYSKVYMKTLHNQLSAIFNHAVRFYNLKDNPARIAGNMGSEQGSKMNFWTTDEYKLFSESMMEKPRSYYAFEVLYWCGLRLGEMLALTSADLDFKNKTLTVNKTYHKSKGIEYVTSPKTEKSNRTITMPDFLSEELQEYLDSFIEINEQDRMFKLTKGYIECELQRGIREQNLKRIRVHDLRHSHVSLLIDMGYTAVAIADRMGHESINITYRYAHLFPNVQGDIANKLNSLKGGY